jgi:hypothetical protein
VSANFTNGMTPVVNGQSVIVSGNGGPTVAFAVARRNNQWTTETLWENMDSQLRFTNPVVIGNALIGMSSRNSGQYYSVDAATGKTLWLSEPRQAGNAAVAKAGNLVFFLEDDGELLVARGNAAAFEAVKRGIERALANVQSLARNLMKALRNGPPMTSFKTQGLEDQEVERPLRKVELVFGHRDYLCASTRD